MKIILLIAAAVAAAGQTVTFERIDLPGVQLSERGLFYRNRAVDLNRDGKGDLIGVLSSRDGGPALLVYPGARDGSFAEPRRIDLDAEPFLWIARDSNGDDKPDLALASGRCCIRVLFGDGSGGFSPGPSVSYGTEVFDWAAADMNRDGNVDLVVHWNYYPYGRTQVLLGRGDAAFEVVVAGSKANVVTVAVGR